MALTLDQIRDNNPEYNGLSNDWLFNHLHKEYYSDIPREKLAEEVGYQFPDKPFSDDLAEARHQFAGGVAVDFNKAVGQAAQAFSPDDSAVSDWGKGVVERADARAPDYELNTEGRGLLAEYAAKGARAAPLSLATLPAYAGGPVVGGAATAALFGGSSYQDEKDRVLKAGGSEEDAHNAGLAVGAVNGLGEAAANKFSLGLLTGAGRAAGQTIENVIGNATDDAILKPLGKAYGKALVGENLTENAQSLGQEAIERQYGVGQSSYPDLLKETTGTTTALTTMMAPFGGPAHIRNSQHAKALDTLLADPQIGTSDDKLNAVNTLHQEAKQMGVPDADNWLSGALKDIQNNAPIRRTSQVDIGDIGQASTVDEAINAHSRALNDVNPDSELNLSGTGNVDDLISNASKSVENDLLNISSLKTKTGFGQLSEFGNFRDQLEQEKQKELDALLNKQALQRESTLETLNNTLGAQAQKDSQNNRLSVLNSVLDDNGVQNKADYFKSELKRQGYNNPELTDLETSHLNNYFGLLNKDEAAQENRLPSSPDETVIYNKRSEKPTDAEQTKPVDINPYIDEPEQVFRQNAGNADQVGVDEGLSNLDRWKSLNQNNLPDPALSQQTDTPTAEPVNTNQSIPALQNETPVIDDRVRVIHKADGRTGTLVNIKGNSAKVSWDDGGPTSGRVPLSNIIKTPPVEPAISTIEDNQDGEKSIEESPNATSRQERLLNETPEQSGDFPATHKLSNGLPVIDQGDNLFVDANNKYHLGDEQTQPIENNGTSGTDFRGKSGNDGSSPAPDGELEQPTNEASRAAGIKAAEADSKEQLADENRLPEIRRVDSDDVKKKSVAKDSMADIQPQEESMGEAAKSLRREEAAPSEESYTNEALVDAGPDLSRPKVAETRQEYYSNNQPNIPLPVQRIEAEHKNNKATGLSKISKISPVDINGVTYYAAEERNPSVKGPIFALYDAHDNPVNSAIMPDGKDVSINTGQKVFAQFKKHLTGSLTGAELKDSYYYDKERVANNRAGKYSAGKDSENSNIQINDRQMGGAYNNGLDKAVQDSVAKGNRKPTHELSDGTPATLVEGNIFLDANGYEVQDDYATLIQNNPTLSKSTELKQGQDEKQDIQRSTLPKRGNDRLELIAPNPSVDQHDGHLPVSQQSEAIPGVVDNAASTNAIAPILTKPKGKYIIDAIRDYNKANPDAPATTRDSEHEAIRNNYGTEVDKAAASLPFDQYKTLKINKGQPDGVVRQAYDGLRDEYGISDSKPEAGDTWNGGVGPRKIEKVENGRAYISTNGQTSTLDISPVEEVNRLRLEDEARHREAEKATAIPLDGRTDTGGNVAAADISPERSTIPAPGEEEVVRGTVGGKVSPKQVLLTASGREMTPHPGIKIPKKADKWLLENAAQEAESRGDDFNARVFRSDMGAKVIPSESKDSAEEYLFGQQPNVQHPFTKPLITKGDESLATKFADEAIADRNKEVSSLKKKATESRSKGHEEIAQRYEGMADEYSEINEEEFRRDVEDNLSYYADSNIDPFLRFKSRVANRDQKTTPPETSAISSNGRANQDGDVAETGAGSGRPNVSEKAKSILKGRFESTVDHINEYNRLHGYGEENFIGDSSKNARHVIDVAADDNLKSASSSDIGKSIDRHTKRLSDADNRRIDRIGKGRTKGAGAGGFNRDIDRIETGINIERDAIKRLQAELNRRSAVSDTEIEKEVKQDQSIDSNNVASTQDLETKDFADNSEFQLNKELDDAWNNLKPGTTYLVKNLESGEFEETRVQPNNSESQSTKESASDGHEALAQITNTIFTEDAAEKARKLLKSKLGQLSSGLDPEIMQAGITLAGYHIEKGARTFSAYAKAMVDDLGDIVKPYLKSWYLGVKYDPKAAGFDGMDSAADVDAINIEALENNNVPSTDSNLESDSGDTGVKDRGNEETIRNERGADGQGTGRSGEEIEGTRNAAGDHSGDSINPAAGRRKRSNKPLHSTEQPAVSSELSPGVADSERSGNDSNAGIQAGFKAESAIKALAEQGNKAPVATKRVVLSDPDNIAATLPVLNSGQKADVQFAEKRLQDNKGVLFTNGTGTGKTFTALGIIKRFVLQGKRNIIIAVPSQNIIDQWGKAAKSFFDIDITPLKNTKDSGKGVVITTYANFGMNQSLVNREWDMVVTDESHKLMQGENGDSTDALNTLRGLTYHRKGFFHWFNAKYSDVVEELQAARQDKKAASGDDVMAQIYQAAEARYNKAEKAYYEAKKQAESEYQALQKDRQPKVVFLSATPFAYVKAIDYAEGYLFDYGEDKSGSAYNSGDNQDQFFMQHFGYRMRYNKLTRPDAKVDAGVMERQFNATLRKAGALSFRGLDVDFDYDRKFVLTESAIGQRIDKAMEWIREKNYRELSDELNDKFDYLQRRYLLESLKAKEALSIVREHLALGRKVIVFHDYKKGGATNPFNFSSNGNDVLAQQIEEFNAEFGDIKRNFGSLPSPVSVFQSEFGDEAIYNGDVSPKKRIELVKQFNDDESGKNVLLIQSASAKEGVSFHDTTGKHQRVLINIGLPTAPTTAIQQEGRIYRVGQASDAVFRYLNTGTNWERWAFASTIAQRASTAENLAAGEGARALKDAFIAAFENSDTYTAGHENEGKGGKEEDKSSTSSITEFDRAKTLYYGQGKKTSRNKSAEGTDYYATPEPVGCMMAQIADARPGDSMLEPSAGHGAIARWFRDDAKRTAVEPSGELSSRLALVFYGDVKREQFERLDIHNKYDAIVMNPPFGVGGKTAIEHLDKAFKHLKMGGRIVALIPDGPTANKRLEAWLYGEKAAPDAYLSADINLPTVTFERAGTAVKTHIVVIDKIAKEDALSLQQQNRDYSGETDINSLFDRIENLSIQPRQIKASEVNAASHDVFESIDTKHTKTGKDLFSVKPTKHLGDNYQKVNNLVKDNNGYYSRFTKSFIFESADDRTKFLNAVNASDIKFSKSNNKDIELLNELAKDDDIFRHPVSNETTLKGVMADIIPIFKYLKDDVRNDYVRHTFKTNKGREFFVTEKNNQVWIDVSNLKEGDDGNAIYAAVGNYAFNTGKVYIGDPDGLSEAAVIRRTNLMLSLALRFGSTDFLGSSLEQEIGNPAKGIKPLDWEGTHEDKISSLIDVVTSTLYDNVPILKGYRYDFDNQQFEDKLGRPLRPDWAGRLAREPVSRKIRAGEATLRRGVVLKSIASSTGSEKSELLERIKAIRGMESAGLKGLFSKSPSTENPHTEQSLLSSIRSVMDGKFGDGWTNRLLATGKFKVISRDESVNIGGKDAGTSQGFYDPKTDTTYLIASNISKDDDISALLLHEIGVHALTLGRTDKEFQAILKQLEAMRNNPKVKAVLERVPKDTKPEHVFEEVAAYLVQTSPQLSISQRIIQLIRKALRAIGKALPIAERAKWIRWSNTLSTEDITSMATAALKQAPDALMFDNIGQDGNGIRLAYEQGIDDVLDGKGKGSLRLGATPSALIQSGLPNVSLMITEKVVDKAHFDHGLTKKHLKSLPDLLANPLMVFKSDSQPGSFVVITHEYQRTMPIMVAIRPNGEVERITPVNIITSAYSRPVVDIERWIKKGLLISSDKKAALAFATTNGLQLPAVVQLIRKSLQLTIEDNSQSVKKSLSNQEKWSGNAHDYIDKGGDKTGMTNEKLEALVAQYAAVDGKPRREELEAAVGQYRRIEALYFNKDGTPKKDAMLAKNGKPTNLNKAQWIQSRTENFKNWFAGSQSVDENGDPLVVGNNGSGVFVNSAGQKKSATLNAGTFNPHNNDIRFSRTSAAINSVQESDTWRNVADRFDSLSDSAKNNIYALATMRQLVDIGKKGLSSMTDYLNDHTKMNKVIETLMQDADGITKKWEQLVPHSALPLKDAAKKAQNKAEQKKLADVMHYATIYGQDPRKPYTGKADNEEAKGHHHYVSALYRNLNTNAKQVFDEAANTHTAHMKDVISALKGNIEASGAGRAAKEAMIQSLDNNLNESKIYFPLSRFGDYWLYYTENGETYFNMFETQGALNAFKKSHPGIDIESEGLKLKNIDSVDGVSNKFISDITKLTDEIADADERNQIQDAMYQLYLKTLPDISARKHFIHRKKTPGFHEDALRGFASKAFHDAKLIGRLQYRGKLERHINDMSQAIEAAQNRRSRNRMVDKLELLDHLYNGTDPEGEDKVQALFDLQLEYKALEPDANKRQGIIEKDTQTLQSVLAMADNIGSESIKYARILNELKLSHEAMLKPNTNGAAVFFNSLGFLNYLGFSPSAALVNTLQTPTVSLPYMAARYGFARTNHELMKAFKEFVGNKNKDGQLSIETALTGDDKKAFDEMHDRGILTRTRAMDLIGLSEEGVQHGTARRKLMYASAYMFNRAEIMNREITGIAAFRLAMSRPGATFDRAIEYADEVINTTHGDYTGDNRARIMRGNVSRVVTQFKQYSQMMTYLWGKAGLDAIGVTKKKMRGEALTEEDHEAVKLIVGMVALQASAAGVMGLPIGGIMIAAQLIADAADDDDDPIDIEAELKAFIYDHFTDFANINDAIARGPLTAWAGIDFSSRLNQSDLWFREPDHELEGQYGMNYLAETLGGPVVGIIQNILDGKKMISDDHIMQGIEKMLPKAVKDPITAVRLHNEGARTLRGDLIEDINIFEAIAKAGGFNSADLSKQYDENFIKSRIQNEYKRRYSHLMDVAANAKREHDIEAFNDAWKEIQDWNEVNPEMKITRAKILKSVKQRAKTSKKMDGGFLQDKRLRRKTERFEFDN